MAGNRNSGRRKQIDESFKADILKRAWKLTYAFFKNKNVAVEEKQKVATQLVVKDITQKQTLGGDALTKVIIAYSKPEENRLNGYIPNKQEGIVKP